MSNLNWIKIKGGSYAKFNGKIVLRVTTRGPRSQLDVVNRFLKIYGFKADKSKLMAPLSAYDYSHSAFGSYVDLVEYDGFEIVEKKFSSGFKEFFHMITFRPLTEKIATRKREWVEGTAILNFIGRNPRIIKRRFDLVFPVR